MSKDYFCRDCIHNNYGWCKILKRNKLKEINSCESKDDGTDKSTLEFFEAPSAPSEQVEEVNTEAYRVLGKREMLWTIQRQALAIKQEDKLTDEQKFYELCRCLKSIAQVQEFSENLYDVNDIIDSDMDTLMIRNSKEIVKMI